MPILRRILGIVALLALVAGLNSLAIERTLFGMWFVVPMCIAVLAGVGWLALRLMKTAKESAAAHQTSAVYGLSSMVGSLVFLAICMTLYAFVAHFDVSVDLTHEGRRQFSPQTLQMLQGLDQDVDVVCFFLTTGDAKIGGAKERTRRFLERCQQLSWRIKPQFLDMEADFDKLKELGIARVGQEGTIVLRCAGRNRVISLSGTNPRLEERDFTNALINLLRNTQPKVCFMTGHRERDIMDTDPRNGASLLKALLERESYTTERIAVALSNPEFPAGCDVLVINRPETDFQPVELTLIQQYLERGGRLLVLLDPSVKRGAGNEQLRPWLKQQFGINVGADIVVSRSSARADEILLTFDTSNLAIPELDDTSTSFKGCYSSEHPITRGFDLQMTLSRARTVSLEKRLPNNVAGSEILFSLPDTWAETNLEELIQTKHASPSNEENVGEKSLAVTVTMKTALSEGAAGQTKDARIVVLGDSDFVSNDHITVDGHFNFIMNAMSWLSEREDLIAIRPAAVDDPPILLTDKDKQFISWFSTLGVLQVIGVVAAIAYMVRRRTQ